MISPPAWQRIFDLAVATPLLVFATPVVLMLLAAIRFESPGSPLFAQQRVGRGGRSFAMFKLRTMRMGTPDLPSHEVSSLHITNLGRLLRRLKLDELPQLWNVVAGDMSLVGPRPCLITQDELLSAREAHGLLAIRPGITGPGQLLGLDMSDPRRLVEAEASYFTNGRKIADDVELLLLTLAGGGRGDAAVCGTETDPKLPEGD